MSISYLGQSDTIRFDYRQWREKFLRTILYVTAGIGLIAGTIYVLTSENVLFNSIAVGLYIIFLLFTFVKMPFKVRASFFVVVLYGIGLSTLLDTGLSAGASMFFLGWITITALILSPRAGWIATVISLLSIAITGWLFLGGYSSPWNKDVFVGVLGTWVQAGAYLLLLSLIIVRGVSLVLKEFSKAQDTGTSIMQALRQEQTGLADRIKQATSELSQRGNDLETANRSNARRASQFEAIAQVTNSITSLRSIQELLPKITEVISNQFGYYHVGIFLNDSINRYAVLAAANSQGGQAMLARNHQLMIGEQGIVGHAIASGEPRVALAVQEDVAYKDNPDLPGTRSEMALPLRVGDQTLGALDIQSTEPKAFDQEDIQVLSLLATQVSLAIENARLFDQTTRSLAEAESVYRQVLREGWSQWPREEKITGFRSSIRGAVPIITRDPASGDKKGANNRSRLEIPIQLRGETIGTLAIEATDNEQINPDKMDIITAVVERVALAAENARLFDETSRRAYREQMVSEITTKIRSTNDPQVMLETAMRELQKVLGTGNIQLLPNKTSGSPKTPANQVESHPTSQSTS